MESDMDPIFGLPCITESRAMDNARNRNFIADKILAQKFESLDLAKKSISGKFLSSRCDVKDFRESLDLNSAKQSPRLRRGPLEKKPSTGSMSLSQFDKIINEAKDRKNIQLLPVVNHLSSSAKANNPKSFILRRENTVVLKAFDSDPSHIVDLDQYERCLPINRQKHAMRDAWERAISEDIHYKRQRSQLNFLPSSFSSPKGQERLLCESPFQSRFSNVKYFVDHKKQKS